MKPMRLLVITLAFLMVAILFQPVIAQETNTRYGFIRFAHTAVDVGPVDIYLEGTDSPLITNLAYGQYSNIVGLPVNDGPFIVRQAGSAADSEPVFTLSWGVPSNATHLMVLSGLDANKSVILEPVNVLREYVKDKARVRVVNFVSGNPALTVKSGDNMWGENLGYIGVSDVDVDPGTYSVSVEGGSANATKSLTLEANKAYTLLVMGGAEGNPAIDLMVMEAPLNETRVKLINNSRVGLDVYLRQFEPQDNKIASLDAGAMQDLQTYPSGSATFILREQGSQATSQEKGGVSVELTPGRDFTITITGDENGLKAEVTSMELTPAETTFMIGTPEATMEASMEATMQATTEGTPVK